MHKKQFIMPAACLNLQGKTVALYLICFILTFIYVCVWGGGGVGVLISGEGESGREGGRHSCREPVGGGENGREGVRDIEGSAFKLKKNSMAEYD